MRDHIDGSIDLLRNGNTIQGRPISALLFYTISPLLKAIEDLWVPRVIGLLSLLITTILFSKLIVRSGFKATATYGIVALLMINPANAVIVSWAVCFPVMIGVLLAGCGGELAWRTTQERKGRILNCCGALLLGLLGTGCYQLAAGAFLIAPLWHCWFDRNEPNRGIRWLFSMGLYGTSLLVYFLSFKVFKSTIELTGQWAELAGRSKLTDDPIGKLRFLHETILSRGLSGWFRITNVEIEGLSQWITLSLIFAGTLLAMRSIGKNQRRFWLPFSYLISVIGSVLPILVVSGDTAPFRTLVILFPVLLLPIAGIFLHSDRLPPLLKLVILLLATVWAFFAASIGQSHIVAGSQAQLALLKSHFEKRFPKQAPQWMIASGAGSLENPWVHRVADELGYMPFWDSWGLATSIQLTMYELHREELELTMPTQVLIVPNVPNSNALIPPHLDILESFSLPNPKHPSKRFEPYDHPDFPYLLRITGENWYYLNPIGFFHTPVPPTKNEIVVFHPVLNMIHLKTNALHEVSFKKDGDWYNTTPETFPLVTKISTGENFYLGTTATGDALWTPVK